MCLPYLPAAYETFPRFCVYVLYLSFPLSVDSRLLCHSYAVALCVGLYCSSAPGKASHIPVLECLRFPLCHSLRLALPASPLLGVSLSAGAAMRLLSTVLLPAGFEPSAAHNNFSHSVPTYHDPHYNNPTHSSSTRNVLTHSDFTHTFSLLHLFYPQFNSRQYTHPQFPYLSRPYPQSPHPSLLVVLCNIFLDFLIS